jgi:hypothetical protein
MDYLLIIRLESRVSENVDLWNCISFTSEKSRKEYIDKNGLYKKKVSFIAANSVEQFNPRK